MASLFKRNGTYYAEFFDSTREPNVKRFSLRTKNRGEARQRFVEWEQAWNEGLFDPWQHNPFTYNRQQPEGASTLGETLEAFLAEKEKAGRAKATIDNYHTICGLLVRSVGRDKPLSALSTKHVEDYILEEGIAATTRRTRYRHVRAWLRWCEKRGYVQEAVTDDIAPPPKAEKMPKAVREVDLRAIEAAIREDYDAKREQGQVQKGELLWMIPMFWFSLYSGLRPSEIARLRWKHIDFDRSLIRIYKQKNGKEQTVPLTSSARRVLEQVRWGEPNEFIFLAPSADPITRDVESFKRNVARKFKRYRKKAGIMRRITPHGLRHGFCTILAEAGKSAPIIKDAARHADISTSMRYVHIANEKLKAELADVF